MNIGVKCNDNRFGKCTWAVAWCMLLWMGLCCGCTDETPAMQEENTMSVRTFEAMMPMTRLDYAQGDSKRLLWSKGDAFRLYSARAKGAVFSLVSGEGTASGRFSGLDVPGMDHAVYPVSVTNVRLDVGYEELSLPFYGQVQRGNDNTDNLANYSYMVAETGGEASALNFNLLAAQLKMELILPEGFKGNVIGAELLLPPGENHFVADLCPADTTRNVMTHRQAVKLDNITLGSDNTLRAYMMLAPMELENQNLTIAVTTDDDNVDYYYVEVNDLSMKFEAGHVYRVRFLLQAVGELYSASDYTLSADGKTLEQWNSWGDDNRSVNMNKDIHLRRVEFVGRNAIAKPASGSSYYYAGMHQLQLPDRLKEIDWTAFFLMSKQTGKMQVGIGPDVSYVGRTPHQKSYIAWSVSCENEKFSGDKGNLMDKKRETLLSWSLPLEGGSTVTVDEGVKSINNYAFANGYNISRVVLPTTLKSIGWGAFQWINSIEEFVLKTNNPNELTVFNESFNSSLFANAVLTVPAGVKALYEEDDVWGQFEHTNIQEEELFNPIVSWGYRKDKLITKEGNLYTVDCVDYTIPISIGKMMQWKATCCEDWITLSESNGESAEGPVLHLEENYTNEWRYAKVTISAQGMKREVFIQQQPKNYIVPLVLHVLKDGTSKAEPITTEMCMALVDSVNNRYANMPYFDKQGHVIKYMDTHIRVVLPTLDPDGNPTNGVVMHHVGNGVINCRKFLGVNDPMTPWDIEKINMVWRQDKYVNLFIFEFAPESNASGISNMGYVRNLINKQFLGDYVTLSSNYDYYHVPSMHSAAVMAQSFYVAVGKPGVPYGVVDTAVHELGHYFGLWHTFNDAIGDNGDDGVEDTPIYDRDVFNEYKSRVFDNQRAYREGNRTVWNSNEGCNKAWDLLCWRIPLGSASTYSMYALASDEYACTNIMDYGPDYVKYVGMTPGQLQRMRFTLAHSPTVPHGEIFTRGAEERHEFAPDFSIPVVMK